MLSFYDKVVGLLDTGIVVLETDGSVISWNLWMEKRSGIKACDIEGKHLLEFLPELKKTRIERGIHKALNLNCPSVLSAKLLDASFPLYRDPIIGKERVQKLVQSILIKPFRTEDTTQYCVISIFDISSASMREKALRTQSITLTDLVERLQKKGQELRVSIRELEEVKEKLEKQNDELAQFAYRTSHDLRAPITASKRLIRYVIDDVKTANPEEALENAIKIERLMVNLENLVGDITSLVSADLKIEEKEPINITDVLNEIKERLSLAASENNCDIVCSIHGVKSIFIERSRFCQIVENLVSNGIKYCNRDIEQRFVKVTITNSGTKLAVSVEDNGVGVPKQYQEEMFTVFKRFHPGLSTGSGLGTSIVKKHVDYLSGNIDFSSSPDGTVFNIVLPLGLGTSGVNDE